MSDNAKQFLHELLKIHGNDVCCDCRAPLPNWASYNLGILICDECAGIHRGLGSHISKVKSFLLDKWDEIHRQHLRDMGNIKAQALYEAKVPAYYRTPKAMDPLALREQWIRAKYERKEFMAGSDLQPLTPNTIKEGFMYKRGKADKKFHRRKFVLNASDGTLKYFVKETKSDPKATLHIVDINLCLVPDKIGNQNGMQIVTNENGHTRSIFVYAEDSKELIDWYMAVRGAKYHRLCIAYPFAKPEEFYNDLTRDFIKEGYLSKTGPRPTDVYRKRWFTLDKRKLMYGEDPMDAYPKGEIFIGTKEKGFVIREGVPPGVKSMPYCFTLKTPERNFNFAAETRDEQQDWMLVLKRVISDPMTPQESSSMSRHGGHHK